VEMVGEHVGGASPVVFDVHSELVEDLGYFSCNSCAWVSEQWSHGRWSLQQQWEKLTNVTMWAWFYSGGFNLLPICKVIWDRR
jgi:hypothetical protein